MVTRNCSSNDSRVVDEATLAEEAEDLLGYRAAVLGPTLWLELIWTFHRARILLPVQ